MDWDIIKDLGLVLFVVFLLIVGIIGGISGLYAFTDSRSCEANSKALALQHSWGFWQGCYVVTAEGDNLPLSTYLERNVTQNIHVK